MFLQWLLRQAEGKPFRRVLMNEPSKVVNLAIGPTVMKVPICYQDNILTLTEATFRLLLLNVNDFLK